MTKKTTPAKVAAPVVVTPAIASDIGSFKVPKIAKKIHAVRAEVTLSDGTVKIFSGVAQDSELDLTKIEVNG